MNTRMMASQAASGGVTPYPKNQASKLLRQKTEASGSVKGQTVAIEEWLDYPPIPEGDPQTGFAYCDYCSEPISLPLSEENSK